MSGPSSIPMTGTPESITSNESSLLRPADAARQLGIPASTLRRWSRRFASFLSPEANGAARENGVRGHRRYTPRDLAVLAHCKDLLSEGYTFEQVTAALESDFRLDTPIIEGEVEVEMPPEANAFPEEMAGGEEPVEMITGEDAVGVGRMMAQLLASLSGSQQIIISGQQTEKELLGVLLQDNFNLKEENRKLRERMVETERRIFEMRREMEKNRKDEQDRMRQMEAYLFQLQRQMDDLVRRQGATPTAGYPTIAAHPVAPAPAPDLSAPPVRRPPAPATTPAESAVAPVADESAASAPAPQSAPAPRKRSFWDWLLGR